MTADAVYPTALAGGGRGLVSDWVTVVPDGTVSIGQGKVELGQGIATALAQLAAEELDVEWTRVRVTRANTVTVPDEGSTSGSRSVMDSGQAIRAVCAQARRLLVDAAARTFGVLPESLHVTDGSIHGPGEAVLTSYWDLDPAVLAQPVTADTPEKPAADHRLVGRRIPRLDLPAKFAGKPSYIQDLTPLGLLYGRVVRPPAPGQRLASLDETPVRAMPCIVAVIREGNLLGVVASREEEAVRAAESLRKRAQWEPGDGIPAYDAVTDLTELPAVDTAVARAEDHAAPEVDRTLSGRFSRPYLAHASIATGCGIARWSGEIVDVWSNTQGPYALRSAISSALRLPAECVRVWHAESSGCYGHNGTDDAAFDAVMLARTVPGRPVQVIWSRADEFGWEPFGPAMTVEVRVGVDADGGLVSWRHDVWGGGHSSRPGSGDRPNLLGALEAAGEDDVPLSVDPPVDGGTSRNAVPPYAVADLEVTAHRIVRTPLRTSSMRALGSMINVFAIESMMDDLAHSLGSDPVKYRLRHLREARARETLRAAADAAGWTDRVAGDDMGWGVGYSRYKNYSGYCAVVARIEAVDEIRVTDLYVAVDVGQVVNPDGLANQIEGGAIQATSWALREEVRFDGRTVLNRDWESYPVLRFGETPDVRVTIVPRQDQPPLGAGEIMVGPVTAAIGNAVADALGVRVADLPFTTEHVTRRLLRD